MSRAARSFAALAVLAAATACGLLPQPPRAKPVNFWLADARDLDNVRRVMVLPFAEAPGVTQDTRPVRDAFLTELGKVQRFELVPLPAHAGEERELHDALARGRISTEALVALGARYQLDGILLGTVTAFRPYKPPHLGVRVQLVSVHSGSTVWAADGLYDTTDASTIEDLHHFSRSFAAEEESMHGWEVHLISPARFAAFVAHRLAATWRSRG